MQGGETEPGATRHDLEDDAFHRLSSAFLDDARRPSSVRELRELLGDGYDELPSRMRASLDGMSPEELAEIGRMASWMRDRDLVYELPGGKVCLF